MCRRQGARSRSAGTGSVRPERRRRARRRARFSSRVSGADRSRSPARPSSARSSNRSRVATASESKLGTSVKGKTEVPHRAEQPLRTDPRAVVTGCFGSTPCAMTQPDQPAPASNDRDAGTPARMPSSAPCVPIPRPSWPGVGCSGTVTEIDERSESFWRRATLLAKITAAGIALLCLLVVAVVLYVHFGTPHPTGD